MASEATEPSARGAVFDIQRLSIHDGPGIRTTVFVKGCPLRCAWCHNPEGFERRPQLAFTPALCIGCGYCVRTCPHQGHVIDETGHHLDRDRCAQCFACAEECYSNALEVIGKEMTVEEVLAEVVKDKVFYEESGGGMTVSGGEPLAQFAFTRQLLEGARQRGLHTCLETSGFAPTDHFAALLPLVDLFLFDYKESDPERHEAYTGGSNDVILGNLHFLDHHSADIILRCPIVPGLNLRDDHLTGIVAVACSLSHCRAIHILGYHALGQAKHARLGHATDPADTRTMTRDEVERVAARVRELGGENVVAG